MPHRFLIRLGLPLLLGLPASASAQNTAPPQVLADSIVVTIARFESWGYLGPDGSSMTARSVCDWTQSSTRKLCQALTKAQAGAPLLSPGLVIGERAPRPTVAEPGGTIEGRILNGPLGFRPGSQNQDMLEGGRTLRELQHDRPDWGLVWWGLGVYALDVDGNADSAVTFLTRASALGGLAPGILQLDLARAWYRQGNLGEGRRALATALDDTTRMARWNLRIRLGRTVEWTRNLRSEDLSIPLDRSTWLPILEERFTLPAIRWPILAKPNLYRVGDLGRGSELVIPMVVQRHNLERLDTPTPDGRPIFPIRVRITAIPVGGGVPIVSDTLRFLASPEIPPPGPVRDPGMVGFVTRLPIPPGRYVVMVNLRQPGGGGSLHAFHDEVVVGPDTPGLRVSDLVAANAASPLRISAPEGTLPLSPWAEIPENRSLLLRAALSGLQPDDSIDVRIHFEARAESYARYDTRRPVSTIGGSSPTIRFTVYPTTEHYVLRREIPLETIPPGPYCVVLTVSHRGEEVVRTAGIDVGEWSPRRVEPHVAGFRGAAHPRLPGHRCHAPRRVLAGVGGGCSVLWVECAHSVRLRRATAGGAGGGLGAVRRPHLTRLTLALLLCLPAPAGAQNTAPADSIPPTLRSIPLDHQVQQRQQQQGEQRGRDQTADDHRRQRALHLRTGSP